ncbi:MAG: hypothetical protein GY941_30320 [Planctomycetes bacterium]|nr:hypothetical protein [Planctomycetota bacterium]
MKNVPKCISMNRKESKIDGTYEKRKPAGNKSKQKRACLRCERKFISSGPYNRICEKCRLANERISSSAYSINGASKVPKHMVEREMHKLN